MLPATISGIVASFEAISSTCASRFRPDATSSTMTENGRAPSASASGLIIAPSSSRTMPRALGHRAQLAERDVARQVHAAAVGVDDQPLGRA